MGWIWEHVLVPLLEVLYVPCDWLLGWSAAFGPVIGVSIVGVISGAAVILVQKYGSNQGLLARCKADLAWLKRRMRACKASGDAEGLGRAKALQGRIGGKYMGLALKPALATVPIIGLVGLWCGARMGFMPVRPGEPVTVIAHFEDQAKGFAHAITEGPLDVTGGAVAAVEIPADGGKQARFQVTAKEPGEGRLTIRYAGRSHELGIPVAARGGRPPEPVTVYATSTPSQDALQAVEVKLKPSMEAAWWNLKLEWGGLYLLTAMIVALALRFALGVQ
jgi:uncharacterized membrane protein (DUF106 family)